MYVVSFTPKAFEQYNQWATEDNRVFKRLVGIIKDCQRDPYRGIGKPEALKHELKGYWSRRITDEHRLVYRVSADTIFIISCRYHY
ncbi:MAG: Txe/YoeB family addiction module toxin [Flavobacteriales bacterium]